MRFANPLSPSAKSFVSSFRDTAATRSSNSRHIGGRCRVRPYGATSTLSALAGASEIETFPRQVSENKSAMAGETADGKPSGRRRQLTVTLGAASLALLVVLVIPEASELWALAAQERLAPKGRNPTDRHTSWSETEQAANSPLAGRPEQQQDQKLLVTVVDENGVAISSARVILEQVERQTVFKGETDYAGKRQFTDLNPGLYRLRVEKEGFYAVTQNDVRVGETESVEITLNHQQEFVERINVIYSPPAIDPAKTAASENLNTREIIDLPYPVTRDIRYALPLLPGVLQDATGQVHVDGSSTRETFDQLDGFNINAPVSGLFTMRVNVDALRSVEVQSSRYPAEFGKGSGGVLSLITAMGDDRYRFSGTDFLPSLQGRKGIHLNSWTPRATLSGPLRKGKAWFLEALDGEYDLNLIKELPAGADRNPVWRISNLAKAQVNLKQAHIVTGSFLVNHFHSRHAGLSRFNPLETTVNLDQAAYLLTMKDQSLLPNGMLLEVGVGVSQFHTEGRPLGDRTYVISPEGTSGNFFESAEGHSSRLQGIANLVLPPVQWRGRHEFKVGTAIDRISYDQSFERRAFLILRENGTVSRKVAFVGNPSFRRNNFEVSGYAQDRWSLSDRLLVESGVRFDRDEIVRRALVSPRLASSYVLTRDGDTKLVWGIGLYYDATNLDFITRPLTGQRIDFFYDGTGEMLVRAPVETSFQVNERNLKEFRFLNWSVGVERKLPGSVYFRLEFMQKRGYEGMTFINQCTGQQNCFSGLFELRNERRDRYDSVAVTARRTFKGDHVVLASYKRSAARSNAVLDFNLENPLFSPQAGGPPPWDSPNRFISWGFLPLRHGFDLAYTLDWRDGYPFSLVNQDQQLIGAPGSRRFPTYFSLNLALERRFLLLGYQWALRAGFDDLTNRHNPSGVNNNVDSPHFLTFGGLQGRVVTARIRLVGRK